jgi:hypothetical protein
MDDAFTNKLRERWKELRQNVFSDQNILNIIGSYAMILSDPQARNFEKWNILGKPLRNEVPPYARTFNDEIERMKQWLTKRARWIDDNIDLSYQDRLDKNYDPEWVKENYHPARFTDEQQLSLDNTIKKQIDSFGIDNTSFIYALDNDFLNPDSAIKNQPEWVEDLKEGEISGDEVAYRFIKSNVLESYLESLDDAGYFTFLFRVLLNREPNFHDMNDMLGYLSYIKSRDSVLIYLLDTPEFNNLCINIYKITAK